MNELTIDRDEVFEPDNFVWIPTGHALGVPSGIVGYWDGAVADEAPEIDFPEGRIRLSSQYVKMYEPTDAEIDEMLADNVRWGERVGGRPPPIDSRKASTVGGFLANNLFVVAHPESVLRQGLL